MRDRRWLIPVLILTVLGTAAVSVCVGSYPISLEQVVQILTGQMGQTTCRRVFWTLRVPRTVMALAAGGALGLAGGIYQCVFRNQLASPDLTGVASGASLGAACAIVLGASGSQIMGASFVSGLMCLGMVLILVQLSGGEHTGSYVLSGIVVSSAANAGLMLLKYMADPERELAAIEFWTMGSLSAVTSRSLLPSLWAVVIPMVLLLCMGRQTVILAMGSDHARMLGLHPGLWSVILLCLSTLMVAGVVSVTGVIAFVGLIAPHIAYRLYRRRSGGYFAVCILTGSIILLGSDILARLLLGGGELPLSILTVAFSVPVLVVLLWRMREGDDGYGF